MQNNNSDGSRAASARGFMALFAIMLAMGLGLMAFPAEAAPFAYAANINSNTVSLIDTATNPPSVVATVGVGNTPFALAVAPDGKHAYVANSDSGTVSVIDTTTNPNTVAATVGVGNAPFAVVIMPPPVGVPIQGSNRCRRLENLNRKALAFLLFPPLSGLHYERLSIAT